MTSANAAVAKFRVPISRRTGKPCKRCLKACKRCYWHKRRSAHAGHAGHPKKGKPAPPPRPGSIDAQRAATVAAKGTFLQAFIRVGTVTVASEKTGTSRSTHYMWMQNDPDYAEAFADAKVQATELLETEARRRALNGVQRYYQGQPIPDAREYSDVLLMFLLKSLKPEKYRERYDVNQVVTDKRIDPLLVEAVQKMDPARLKRLTAELRALEKDANGGSDTVP